MREMKFRAWDKQEKMFWTEQYPLLAPDGTIYTGTMPSNNPDRYDFQQWTGLKDKADRYIYEGDIVTCEGFGGSYKVVYEGCAFVGKHIESDMTSSVDLEMQTLEIIGNIYENPELL